MALATLADLRTETELLLTVASSDSYVGSAQELKDINRAYEKTAYAYDFPQLLFHVGVPITANVDRYPLPTGFRKFDSLRIQDVLYEETTLEVLKHSQNKYFVDKNASQLILSQIPTTTATTYTLINSPSAATAASITVSSASGLAQYDEIFIDSASGTDEFTLVSSVSGTTVTARLRAAKTSGDVFYRQKEILDIFYYRNVVLLASSTDTMILPDELDYTVPLYAAALGYQRLEDYNKAKELMAMWESQTRAAFLAQDKNSIGPAGQFVIG